MKLNHEEILKTYTIRTGQMFENFGFPKISGEIGALLYLREGKMSLDEISSFLNISKGSASTNCRYLKRMKFIKSVSNSEDRKTYYQFHNDLWPALKMSLDSFVRNEVDDFRDINEEVSQKIMYEKSESFRHLKKRLKELNQLFTLIDKLVSFSEILRGKPITLILKSLKRIKILS